PGRTEELGQGDGYGARPERDRYIGKVDVPAPLRAARVANSECDAWMREITIAGNAQQRPRSLGRGAMRDDDLGDAVAGELELEPAQQRVAIERRRPAESELQLDVSDGGRVAAGREPPRESGADARRAPEPLHGAEAQPLTSAA